MDETRGIVGHDHSATGVIALNDTRGIVGKQLMKRVELWDTTTALHALGERNSVRHLGTVIVQRFHGVIAIKSH